MKARCFLFLIIVSAVLTGFGCDNATNSLSTSENVVGVQKTGEDVLTPAAPPLISGDETPPSPLVTVAAAENPLTFWPFTGTDFSGADQDPMNLIFVGNVSARDLREALLALNGNRTNFGFPGDPPFDCTWQDAIGGVQTGYGEPAGWVGNAIQLECGEYETIRFHIRFFEVGDYTLGGIHFEVLIPGTTAHQVISWELAEQFVTVDFLRSELFFGGVPTQTQTINFPPFGEIPAVIYNGLPVALRAAIGGPLEDVVDPEPIFADGRATILNRVGSVPAEQMVSGQDFVINFNQVIPKLFCASGPFDFLLVQGPVKLNQQVIVTPSGNFISHLHAKGHLDITPVNPLTNQLGETYRAIVNEIHKGIQTDSVTLVSSFQMQIEIPPEGPFRGQLLVHLQVGPGESSQHSIDVKCDP